MKSLISGRISWYLLKLILEQQGRHWLQNFSMHWVTVALKYKRCGDKDMMAPPSWKVYRRVSNRGVQARIKRVVTQAQYTHCHAHQLNLCIVHACRITDVWNIMDIVQQISFSFNLCAKKLLAFHERLEIDATAQEALHNRKKLQSLCETRWASRAEALNAFKAAFTTVVSAL